MFSGGWGQGEVESDASLIPLNPACRGQARPGIRLKVAQGKSQLKTQKSGSSLWAPINFGQSTFLWARLI